MDQIQKAIARHLRADSTKKMPGSFEYISIGHFA